MATSFTLKHRIDAHEVNPENELSIHEMMILFEDIAANHTKMYNCDRNYIAEHNGLIWVLTKIKLNIISVANYYDEINIQTKAYAPQKIKFDRDFVIKKDNQILYQAMSEWCLLDINTRIPKRSSTIDFPLGDLDETRLMDDKYFNIHLSIDDMELVYEKTIRYSDLDINNHTNNVYYNDFALDVFDSQFL